ncbi:hypothetical protein PAHAL_1G184100 [Panicum hallii]|uniref:Uncharacterized protein n=1 Tax=Panicum hallii TaxID=206008 RepID=A0A2T8KVR4_9POAL|nr:hypothetical protein PAHAL_1G184100 [Panicum hallii]
MARSGGSSDGELPGGSGGGAARLGGAAAAWRGVAERSGAAGQRQRRRASQGELRARRGGSLPGRSPPAAAGSFPG